MPNISTDVPFRPHNSIFTATVFGCLPDGTSAVVLGRFRLSRIVNRFLSVIGLGQESIYFIVNESILLQWFMTHNSQYLGIHPTLQPTLYLPTFCSAPASTSSTSGALSPIRQPFTRLPPPSDSRGSQRRRSHSRRCNFASSHSTSCSWAMMAGSRLEKEFWKWGEVSLLLESINRLIRNDAATNIKSEPNQCPKTNKREHQTRSIQRELRERMGLRLRVFTPGPQAVRTRDHAT